MTKPPEPDRPSRDWFGDIATVIGQAVGVCCMLAVIGVPIWLAVSPPHRSPHPTHSPSPLSNKGYAYWYCWNRGAPHPHHLGAPVHGDHVCSEEELQQATETP